MKERDKNSNPMSEYMKIRQYVIGIIAKSGNKSILIPSMPELGRIFGVTRMTVHKALKDLVRDRYLIVQAGIGTFTNPQMSIKTRYGKDCRFVGVITGDGKIYQYDYYFWNLISHAGQSLVAGKYLAKPIQLCGTSVEEVLAEVKNYWLDGLIWIAPEEQLLELVKLLHKENFPVVVMEQIMDGVNCVCMDYETEGYEAGQMFLKEGRHNVVFAVRTGAELSEARLKGLKRAFSEAGVKFNDGLVLKDQSGLTEDLDRLFELGLNIQGIYLVGGYLPEVSAAMQRNNIDMKTQCRILTGDNDLAYIDKFYGIVRKHRFEDEGKLAVEMLARMINEADFNVEHKFVKFPLLMAEK